MFTVSDVVRNKAAALGADDWVDQLPELVSSLADEWKFTPIRPLDGGTESFLLEVRQSDGAMAVLKLLLPRDIDVARHEIAVLQLAGGDGCPLLLNHDRDRGAVLMERRTPRSISLRPRDADAQPSQDLVLGRSAAVALRPR